MITPIARGLIVASFLVATARPLAGQQPIAPRGAIDPARRGLIAVDPPAPLSRDELARRLKALDGSLPNVLPPGAAVLVTPGRLQYGRTRLGIYNAELVALDRRGRPVAVYTERREAGPEGFYIELDAEALSRYSLDLHLTGNAGPGLGGSFDIAVWGPGHSTAASLPPSEDGHLIYVFSAPRAGRYTISIERRPLGSGRWHFYGAELLRMR